MKKFAKLTAMASFVGGLMAAVPAAAEDRAIIVGINSYAYLDDADLNGARADALNFRDFVEDTLGFKASQITLLLDGDATRDNIIKTIVDDLKYRTKPGDRLVFYFAGHGASTKDRDGDEEDGKDEFLVAANAGKENSFGIILDDDLRFLFEYFKDRDILVVVDACYSGTISRNLVGDEELGRTLVLDDGALNLPPLASAPILDGTETESARSGALIPGQEHIDVWSATSSTQVAIENRSGGIFTRLFLEGVGNKKADLNNNGVVSNAELLAFVRQGSAAFCNRSRLCQTKNQGRLTPDFSGAIERAAAFTATESSVITPVIEAAPTQVPVQTAPVPSQEELEAITPAFEAAPTLVPEKEMTPVAEEAPVEETTGATDPSATAESTMTDQTGAGTTPSSDDGTVVFVPPTDTASPDPADGSQQGGQMVDPDTASPDVGTSVTQPATPVASTDPVILPDTSNGDGASAAAPPDPMGQPLPSPNDLPPVLSTNSPPPAFSCSDLQTVSGTAKLEDIFLPGSNDAVALGIRQGDALTVDQTVLFDVNTDRGGRLMVFDLTPGCELYQIFPSILSPARADVLTRPAQVEIPSALSANGQPIVIRVTEPAGRGHLLAVLVEDNLSAIDDLIPPQSQLNAISDGVGHLTELANRLNTVVNDPNGARGSRWHATIVPYTITR